MLLLQVRHVVGVKQVVVRSTKRVGNSYRRTYYNLASAAAAAAALGAAAADAVPYLESFDISSFYPLSSFAWAFVLWRRREERIKNIILIVGAKKLRKLKESSVLRRHHHHNLLMSIITHREPTCFHGQVVKRHRITCRSIRRPF